MADCTRQGRPAALQRGLHRQGVHHRRQHAHIIGGGPVDALGGAGQAAEDVAAADHHADLAAGVGGFLHVRGDAVDGGDVDAELARPHQRLARDLEQNPAVFRRCGHRHGSFAGSKTVL